MIYGRIYCAQDRRLLIEEVMSTGNAFERMRGLLWRPKLQSHQAMLINPCTSIHTIGMGYALDVIFLSKDFRVTKMVENLLPWRMTSAFGSKMVIEMLAGTLGQLNLETGSQLIWEEA